MSSERGFSLVETLVSIGLLTTVAIGVAQLFAVSTSANLRATGATSTALLATQKMEQLRGLTWGFGDATARGLPVTDTTTNLATDPPANNGRGLSPSPAGSLHQSAGRIRRLPRRRRTLGGNGRDSARRHLLRPALVGTAAPRKPEQHPGPASSRCDPQQRPVGDTLDTRASRER